jgi:hypothetical protein
MKHLHRVIASALCAALLLTVGCPGRVSAENYARISDGMSYADVQAILGKGEEKAGVGGVIGNVAGSLRVVHWKSGDRSINITFVNDKVSLKVAKGL